jgi:hypothetical protein
MQLIHPGLFIGDLSACHPGSPSLAVVHACKSPCHQRALNYTGSLSPQHPNYLFLQRSYDLFLNLIDPPVPLFQLESFRLFLLFAAEQTAAARPLLIHCNQGESRAPSLALLLIAVQHKAIPSASYAEARAAFESLYPGYKPGAGLVAFLASNWSHLTGTTA